MNDKKIIKITQCMDNILMWLIIIIIANHNYFSLSYILIGILFIVVFATALY